MKKLLMSSIILLIFSASMFLFQASCKKEVQAEVATSYTAQPLGYFLYEKSSEVISSTGVQTWTYQFWLANYDGTNQRQIPISLPSSVSYYGNNAHLSPDGKKLFIYAYELVSQSFTTNAIHYKDHLYTCNIDGSGFADIINDDINTNHSVNTTTPYGIAGIDGVY